MLYYNQIEVSEGVDIEKIVDIVDVFHYNYLFTIKFHSHRNLCDHWHYLLRKVLIKLQLSLHKEIYTKIILGVKMKL